MIAGVAQGSDEIGDLTAVDFREVGVDGDRHLRPELLELGGESVAFGGQRAHALKQFGQDAAAVGDRVDHAIEAGLGTRMAALERRALANPRSAFGRRQALPLGDIFCHQIGREHIVAQRAEHAILKLVGSDHRGIGAALAGAAAAAPPILTGPNDVTAAAHAAANQPGEEPSRPALLASRDAFENGEAVLDSVPRGAIDDREPGHVGGAPLAFGVRTGDAAAGVGMLLEPLAVVDDAANVERVVQDPGATAAVAENGRGRPFAAGRSADAFGVECLGDRLRSMPGEIVVEDASHDGGLFRVDGALAAIDAAAGVDRGDNRVAVAEPAGDATGFDAPDLAAPGLFGELLDVERGHGAAEADMDRADLALGQRDEAHAGMAQPLPDRGDVLLVAADAVDRLGDDDVVALRLVE